MLPNLAIISSGNTYRTTDRTRIERNKQSHSISTSHPLTHGLTVSCCHSLAQIQLLQIPNTIQDQTDSPLLHHTPKDNVDIHNAHPLKIK